MNYNVKESGARIRNLRKKNNLTQEQAAAELMISLRAYGKIERGECGVSVDLFIGIAAFFDVSLDYLILGREPKGKLLKQQVHTMVEKLMELEGML